MNSVMSLFKSKQIILRVLCLILCFAISIISLGACSSSEKQDKTSSDISSEEQNPTDEDSKETLDDDFYDDEEFEEEYSDDFYDDYYEEEPIDETVYLNVYNSRTPVNTNYMGMNATIYHTFGFMKDDRSGRVYTDEMMDIELDRLQGMGFKNCRTAFYPSWLWNNDKKTFDFDADRMGFFVEYCKALQKRGMKVMLNNMWYMTMAGAGSQTGCEGYLNGFGADIYGEQAAFADCVAKEFKLKGNKHPFDAGMGYETEHFKTEFFETTVTEYFNRLQISGIRNGLITSKIIQTAKAYGVNNIDYLIYFTEPSSNSYTPDDPKGPHEQEYLFLSRTIRNVLDKTGVGKSLKHVGPNQGHITSGDGLLKYVMQKDPDLFDVVTSHFYPTSSDVSADVYYDYCYDAINNYSRTMKDHKAWGKKEFWQDEYFASIQDYSHVKENPYSGVQTVVGAICSQQMGVDNVLMWQAFDQLWTDNAENAWEFENGIHITGTCPSLFVSQTPYPTYYTTGLFTRYNNSVKGGKAIATSSGDYSDYPGVYIGATELPDGNITITVVSVNIVETTFQIDFDKALNRSLHRHKEDSLNRVPKTSAIIAEADGTFKNVKTVLRDTIAPYAVHIYTTCEF